MTQTKLYAMGGESIKSLPLNDFGAWIDSGIADAWGLGDSSQVTAPGAYSLLGWMYRCVGVRAASLSSMPWSIFRGEDEIATHDGDNDTAQIDWLDDIATLLWLTEASLSIVSEAYLFKDRTRGKKTTGLRMLAADTMTPKWMPDGIAAFERRVNQRTFTIEPERVVYFRLPNPLHETEPGTSPAQAALADMGVMVNLTAFASQFFKRGAVRATLLTVDGNPPPAEKERLKSWWQRVISGISNAWGAEVVSAAVNPIIVGDGIESLNNEALTTEKRESISTAFGVPHSLVMSNAANFATAEADRLNFYDTTIIPEARMIERVLNRQLFDDMGLRFRFQPEQMTLYQADENERATAFQAYVNSGLPHSLVAEMLGLALPPGWEYADLDPDEPEPETDPNEDEQTDDVDDAPEDDEESTNREAKAAEATTFRKWLKKRQNPDPGKFKCEHLSDSEKSAIVAEVTGDGTAEDTPFVVTLPENGRLTPEWVKALILQLDDDDDEAEQAARMAIERRTARRLADSLEDWISSVLDGLTEAEVDQLAALMRSGSVTFRDVLERALVDSADLGVSVAVAQLDAIGYGFDYTLANASARDWARQYVGTIEGAGELWQEYNSLIAQINATNDRVIGEAVSRWIENGEPLQSLVDDIAGSIGGTRDAARRRADLIASTEVTRAYAEGNMAAYRESGVVSRAQWRTANDEKVCPVCGPMGGLLNSNGEQAPQPLGAQVGVTSGLDNPQFVHPVTGQAYGPPPAHPRCRCWVVPVIQEPTDGE